ncbi:MAG: type I polyketide synthase [Chitinophagales bacterium]
MVSEPGIIDNLSFKEIIRTAPANNEVEVEVKALGINFMNLMSVLGIYPGKENGFATLGIECSGVVTKVGKSVSHLNIGDEVLGMAYDSMASHVVLNAGLLRKKPSNLSFEEAATIPAVFLTSYYALIHLGRMKKGERVLIHSATGGVGLSAIQIAQAVGAEIYATAGTKEKRDLLLSLGVKHVYNSRTLAFADQIKEDTNGEGIDLVLNSLTGEAMIRSMELLRSFGRFLEIGKKDVYENSRLGLSIFDKAISYSMIDLEKMLFETPEVLGELLEDVLKHFEDGSYQPLQYQSFGISKAKEAFEFMSKAKHLGKIIISVADENPEIALNQHPKKEFSAEATYLLTGGYGGLGITFANWMINNGARNLVLLGRSGPKPFAQKIIDELVQKGANIHIEKADVSSKTDLEKIVNAISSEQPLKGIMHLAGILDDSAVSNLAQEQFERVLKPKVNGAWHLHELTKDLDLDFFVLFSSSAGLFGSPGQAAYVAANTFLDALAAFRKNNGLEALSINWGTVSDIGLAAEAGNRADRLAEEGVLTMSPNECLDVYETIADDHSATIGAFRFDLEKWQKAYLSAAKNPFFEHLRGDIEEDNNQQAASFIEELQQLNNDDSLKEAIQQKLKELVGGVVKKAADKINIKTPFKSLGIDSLMSIQLKNKLEAAFEIPISVTSFWTYSNIRDYTKFLIEELALDSSGEPAIEVNETPKEIVETKVVEIEEVSIDDISDDDISDLLAAELNDL